MRRMMGILALCMGPIFAITAAAAGQDRGVKASTMVPDPNYVPTVGSRAVLFSVGSERIPLGLWCATTRPQWLDFIKGLFSDAKPAARGKAMAVGILYLAPRTAIEVVGCESIRVDGGDGEEPLTCTCCTIRVLSGPYRGKTFFTPDFQITRLVESRAVPPDSRETAMAPAGVVDASPAPRPPVMLEAARRASSRSVVTGTASPSPGPPTTTEAPSLKPPVVAEAVSPPSAGVTAASTPLRVERETPATSPPLATPAPASTPEQPTEPARAPRSRTTMAVVPARGASLFPSAPVGATTPSTAQGTNERASAVMPTRSRPESTDVASRSPGHVSRSLPPLRSDAARSPALRPRRGEGTTTSAPGGRIMIADDPPRVGSLPVDRRRGSEGASPGGPAATNRDAPARLPSASAPADSSAGLYEKARELDEDHKVLEALGQYRVLIKTRVLESPGYVTRRLSPVSTDLSHVAAGDAGSQGLARGQAKR